MWRHKSGSTLAQVLAGCLMAPSHHKNKCWLPIRVVLWHSPEGNFKLPFCTLNLQITFWHVLHISQRPMSKTMRLIAFMLHMDLLPNTLNSGLRMRRECRERFPCQLTLAIPTCITARAWHTCRDAWQDRQLAVSFEVSGGENVPGIPGACATHNFTYLAWGPLAHTE